MTQDDLNRFDLILAMDQDNRSALRRMGNRENNRNIRLFLQNPDQEVPDPYYGGPEGFESVYQLVKGGSLSLLDELQRL